MNKHKMTLVMIEEKNVYMHPVAQEMWGRRGSDQGDMKR
jgi:hypothetical protein